MPSITEGRLSFQFPDGWKVTTFDKWSFYRNQFQSVCGGVKAIDLLAVEQRNCFWSIEVKDYRQQRRTKVIDLADEVAVKVRDTLASLVAAQANADDRDERAMAKAALRCRCLRVVLHLEQPRTHSRLFPRAIDPADVQQRLRQLVKAIDPHPLVLEKGRLGKVAWSVA